MEQITYNTATVNQLEECIDLLKITFCESEPMSRAQQLTEDEFGPFVRIYTTRSVNNGHTFVAVDSNKKVVGCLMAEDFVIELPTGWDKLDPKLGNVFDILGKLDSSYRNKNPNIRSGEIFHLYMMGVYPLFTNKSIGRNLLVYAEKIAKSQGFKKLAGEVTGPISQKILKSLGYITMESIFYSEYEINGSYIYSEITDCESCDLVVKEI